MSGTTVAQRPLQSPELAASDGSADRRTRATRRAALIALTAVLILATGLRLYRMAPLEVALLYAQDADEGVYATTAQLALQGYLPYRDFFTPMPPFAIYLYMGVLRLVYHPWGSTTGFVALRYLSVTLGLATVFMTFLAARALAGAGAGLFASFLLAVDGIVIAQDRRAMLEAPTNALSLAAFLLLLYFFRQCDKQQGANSRLLKLLVAGAGILSALAILVKGTALVVPAVILIALLARRGSSPGGFPRWSQISYFLGSLLFTYLLGAGAFLARCPNEFVKQMYFFHMLRPSDGTASPLLRLVEMWRYPWSWTTLRVGIAGLVLGVIPGICIRNRPGFWVVAGWTAAVLALVLTSRTYFATYFSQLAVPLSIAGGTIARPESAQALRSLADRLTGVSARAQHVILVIIGVTILAVSAPFLLRQASTTQSALRQSKSIYMDVSAYISRHLPAAEPILVFEPNYTFLASRPLGDPREGPLFVDSYGEMLYRNIGIAEGSIPDLLSIWTSQTETTAAEVFQGPSAQAAVMTAFRSTRYIILDARASKQLTAETWNALRSESRQVAAFQGAELRERLAE